jgi:hypothetical protein
VVGLVGAGRGFCRWALADGLDTGTARIHVRHLAGLYLQPPCMKRPTTTRGLVPGDSNNSTPGPGVRAVLTLSAGCRDRRAASVHPCVEWGSARDTCRRNRVRGTLTPRLRWLARTCLAPHHAHPRRPASPIRGCGTDACRRRRAV